MSISEDGDGFSLDELRSTSSVMDRPGLPLAELLPYEDVGSEWRPVGDCAYVVGSAVAISRRAEMALKQFFVGAAEWLPISLASEPSQREFGLLHVMHKIGPIDRERSILVYGQTSGEIIAAEQLVFRREQVDSPIFRMNIVYPSRIYVTDEVVSCVQKHELVGFTFPLVWSDEG